MPGVSIIAPPCAGATPLRHGKISGLALAGEAIERAGLPARLEAFDVRIERTHRPLLPEELLSGDPVSDLGTYSGKIAKAVKSAIGSGSWPVLTGGSCNHLPGMIGGIQQALGATTRLGLLWLDAHGDFNTPHTTPSGMLGGMPVAVGAGLCHAVWREQAGIASPLPTNRIMMIDVRNLDPAEEELIRATDVAIMRFPAGGNENEVLDAVRTFAGSVDALHVHVDADVLDASLQPNHPTVEPDGLDVRQTLAVVETAMETGKAVAFGVVSINPTEPGGSVSLASGMEVIVGGVAAWAAARASV